MDELGKSFPAAEGMVDAETGSPKKQVNEYCLNCGTKLQDIFCHHCGQKDIPARQTLGELWTNFISSFWSYEGKFFQTTKYLVTRPGYLAMEYNQGKRESYYHPARMYVFISFVYFLLFFSLPDPDDNNTAEGMSKADSLEVADIPKRTGNIFTKESLDSVFQNVPMDSADRAEVDSATAIEIEKTKFGNKNVGFSLTKSEYKTTEAYDSAQLAKPENERAGWFVRNIAHKTIELNNRYKDNGQQFKDDFKQAFNDNFSKVLFWLLPFFALVLKLLYIRHDYFYSEHLVFSIYNYNFFFLAASLQMLVDQASWLGWLASLIGFWIFFYLLFAMKRLYLQSWGKTILKFCLFVFLFSLLMGVGFGISVFSILFTI
jgi:hypothetical protein